MASLIALYILHVSLYIATYIHTYSYSIYVLISSIKISIYSTQKQTQIGPPTRSSLQSEMIKEIASNVKDAQRLPYGPSNAINEENLSEGM